MKTEINFATKSDKQFWFTLDRHLSEEEYDNKIRDRRCYVLSVDGKKAGILRYNLFWDNTPFCTLLYIDEEYQRTGCGTKLMERWESDMKSLGYGRLLVSTQADEEAQHFYRKLGFIDCGALLEPNQATELFLGKNL